MDVDRDELFVTAGDGRRLCVADWGDPGDHPVLLLHGTPGCRYNRPPDPLMYTSVGARVVTYDRPGYGGSDRDAGRSVVNCVEDVRAIADALGIGRFSVTGSSGGGPHVLAAAAGLGDRIVRARCNVGLAPYDAEGLDFFAGMDPLNVEEFGWALEGEERATLELERQLAEMKQRVDADPSQLLGADWALDESDRAVLADPLVADQNTVVVAELVRGGVAGWVDDSLAFAKPWGFELGEIAVPVRVTYGMHDVLVPAGHGAWLGRHVPGAEVIVDDGAGHLTALDAITASMRWLVSGA